jgi:hypothetical protein
MTVNCHRFVWSHSGAGIVKGDELAQFRTCRQPIHARVDVVEADRG